jgi:hypothetical protein
VATYLHAVRQAHRFLHARGVAFEAATRADLEPSWPTYSPGGRWPRPRLAFEVLKILYAWLMEEGETSTDPTACMRPPIVPDQPVPIVPEDGLKRLFQTCAGQQLQGPTLDDVDLDLDVLVVLGKGRRERSLPVRTQGRGGARPVLACPSPAQARWAAVAMAGPTGPAHGLGASDDAAPSWPQGRAAQAAPASVQAHVRSPVAACRTCVGAAGAAAAGDRSGIT